MSTIIFGCGSLGKSIYEYYKESHNILYFADNNENLWGQSFFGVPIIAPSELLKLHPTHTLIIASAYYVEILEQLLQIGVNIYENLYFAKNENGFLDSLYHKPVAFTRTDEKDYTKEKPRRTVRKVLFLNLSDAPRLRTYCVMLKKRDILVDLCCLRDMSFPGINAETHPYNQIIPIGNINTLHDMIKHSDYDVIHCFGEGNMFTALAVQAGKPTVHDAIDIASLRNNMGNEKMFEEYVALHCPHGNIFVAYAYKNYAIEKFSLDKSKPMLVIGNWLNEEFTHKATVTKLSSLDGEIHCVYEGGFSVEENHIRNMNDIIKKIALQNIHIHIYPRTLSSNEEILAVFEGLEKYVHIEEICDHEQLVRELRKYDMGLFAIQYNIANVYHFAYTSPNKLYDYLAAGLPVALKSIPKFEDYINDNGFGQTIDFDGDVRAQFEELKQIVIPDDVLKTHGFIMDDYADPLICFYEDLIQYCERTKGVDYPREPK